MKVEVTVASPDDVDLPHSLAGALTYWHRLRRDRWAPTWKEFNLLGLGADVVPYAIVVDVIDEPLDFVYRFWGTANTTNIGYDCTGKSVRDNALFSDKVFRECRQIREERRPLVYFSKVIKDDGLFRAYARMRLPLSNDGRTVTQIVSIVDIKDGLADFLPRGAD